MEAKEKNTIIFKIIAFLFGKHKYRSYNYIVIKNKRYENNVL
jgi:hypothetical protein